MSLFICHEIDDRSFTVTADRDGYETHCWVRRALNSTMFANWILRLDKRIIVENIHFQSIDAFALDRVGFAKFHATVKMFKPDGVIDPVPLPGIIFMRGDSVAILVVLSCGRQRYALMVRQPRLATGELSFLEMPAGMLDGSNDVVGVAVKEALEELGEDFVLKRKDLHLLHRPVYLSCGASDERIHLYYHERSVTRAMMASLRGRTTGCITERERITLDIIPLRQLLQSTNASTIVAYHAYQAKLAARARRRNRF